MTALILQTRTHTPENKLISGVRLIGSEDQHGTVRGPATGACKRRWPPGAAVGGTSSGPAAAVPISSSTACRQLHTPGAQFLQWDSEAQAQLPPTAGPLKSSTHLPEDYFPASSQVQAHLGAIAAILHLQIQKQFNEAWLRLYSNREEFQNHDFDAHILNLALQSGQEGVLGWQPHRPGRPLTWGPPRGDQDTGRAPTEKPQKASAERC